MACSIDLRRKSDCSRTNRIIDWELDPFFSLPFAFTVARGILVSLDNGMRHIYICYVLLFLIASSKLSERTRHFKFAL